MELYDKSAPALQAFFFALFGPVAYISDRFLLLARALEVYHRNKGEFYFMDPKEYENDLRKLKEAIPVSFPKDLRERICQTLDGQNKYSLARRLADLDGSILKARGLVRLPGKIRWRIRVRRNYLTHYQEELRPQVKDGRDMHDFNERMIAVMIVLLFHELGVCRDPVREFLLHRPNLGRFLES